MSAKPLTLTHFANPTHSRRTVVAFKGSMRQYRHRHRHRGAGDGCLRKIAGDGFLLGSVEQGARGVQADPKEVSHIGRSETRRLHA